MTFPKTRISIRLSFLPREGIYVGQKTRIETNGQSTPLTPWQNLHYMLEEAKSRAANLFGNPDEFVEEHGTAL
jgi:hypothetical protein